MSQQSTGTVMNNKPYIFAGSLTDSELIKWLEERVLALKSFEWNRRDITELKKHLLNAENSIHPLTATAHEGIVRQFPDSIRHHAGHQTQSETPSQSPQKETSAQPQEGSQG